MRLRAHNARLRLALKAGDDSLDDQPEPAERIVGAPPAQNLRLVRIRRK